VEDAKKIAEGKKAQETGTAPKSDITSRTAIKIQVK